MRRAVSLLMATAITAIAAIAAIVASAASAGCAREAPVVPARVLGPLPLDAFREETRGFVDTPVAELVAIGGRYGLFHRDASALGFTLDGATLVSASARGTLRVWDTSAQTLRCALAASEGLQPMVETRLAVSDDGHWAATSRRDARLDNDWERSAGIVSVWDVRACRLVRTFTAHQATVVAMAFADDGTLLTFAYEHLTHACDPPPAAAPRGAAPRAPVERGGDLQAWDLASGELRRATRLGPATRVAFANGGRRVAGLDERTQALRVWDVARPGVALWERAGGSGECRYEASPSSLSFADDGRLALVSGLGVRLFDGATGRPAASFALERPLRWSELDHGGYARVAPDGTHVFARVSSTRPSLCVLGGSATCLPLTGPSSNVAGATFSARGGLLAGISGAGTLGLWDLASRAQVTGGGHQAAVASLALSPDGTRALSCSSQEGTQEDRTVRLWEVATGRELQRWELSASSARFSADGAGVLVTLPQTPQPHGSARLFDVASGKTLWTSPGATQDGRFSAGLSAVSKDGSRLARVFFTLEAGHRMTMQDTRTGTALWSASTNGGPVVFAAADRELIATDGEGATWALDAATGQKLRALELARGTRSLSVDPQGAHLIGGSPGLAVYDLPSGRLARVLERDWAGPFVATSDGLVITGEYDGTIRFRRLDGTGEAGRIDLSTSEDRASSLLLVDGERGLLVGTERGVLLRFRRKDPPAAAPAPASLSPPG